MRARSHRFPDEDHGYVDTTHYDEDDNYLDIGFQRLKKISYNSSFEYITKLFVDHNSLSTLPSPKEIPLLEELTCSYNKLKIIPYYPGLVFQNNSQNNISSLSIYKNCKIKYLDCSHNSNLNIDFNLPYCEQLYISDNDLNHIDLRKTPRLELLDCGNNNIETIDGVPKLIELNIQHNKIKSLQQWQSLKHLTANNNNLKTLQTYPSLLTLNINHNQLIHIASQPKLTELIAHHNKHLLRMPWSYCDLGCE